MAVFLGVYLDMNHATSGGASCGSPKKTKNKGGRPRYAILMMDGRDTAGGLLVAYVHDSLPPSETGPFIHKAAAAARRMVHLLEPHR